MKFDFFLFLVCQGGPAMNENKGSSFNKIAGWDDCKEKVKSIVCLGKCKAKKIYYQGKATKKIVTMEVSCGIKVLTSECRNYTENEISYSDVFCALICCKITV